MSEIPPEDVAFNLRFRAAVQEHNARTATSPAMRARHQSNAKRLLIQADLIDQGVPVDRLLK